jgi:hypothetical protein
MILDSIVGGLLTYREWHIWFVSLIYALAIMVFFYIAYAISGNNQQNRRFFVGGLFFTIGGVFLESFLMGIIVAYLFPIFLGLGGTLPLNSLLMDWLPILKVVVFAAVVVSILTIFPLIGDIIAYIQGVQTLIMGIIIFSLFFRGNFGQSLESINVNPSDVFPSIWIVVIYVILAAILNIILMLLLSAVSILFENTSFDETFLLIGGKAIGVLVGLVTLCMYSNYVMLNILQIGIE